MYARYLLKEIMQFINFSTSIPSIKRTKNFKLGLNFAVTKVLLYNQFIMSESEKSNPSQKKDERKSHLEKTQEGKKKEETDPNNITAIEPTEHNTRPGNARSVGAPSVNEAEQQ